MDNPNNPTSALPVPHRPLSAGEILSGGIRLSGRTIRRGGLLALLMLVPLFLVFGEVARAFLLEGSAIMANAAREGPELTPDQFSMAMTSLLGAGTLLSAALLFLLSGIVLAQTAITVDSWDVAMGEGRPWQAWIRRSFGRPYWTGLVQLVLGLALFMLATLAAALLAASLEGAAGTGGSTAVGVFYAGGLIFFAIATALRVHEIVVDDRGPWHSLISSMALVKGQWLRTFAIVALMVIVYQLLSSVASLLLIRGVPMDVPFGPEAQNARALARAWGMLAALMTPAYLLTNAVLSWVMLHVSINVLTALYIDLRARRGDFDMDLVDTSWDHGAQAHGDSGSAG